MASFTNKLFRLMPLPTIFSDKLIDFENTSCASNSRTGVTLTNVLSCWFTNVCSNLAIKGASSYVSKGNGVSSYDLSFYGSKIILDRSNHFGRIPIVSGGFNLFW